jgi:hypothetical protein
MVRPLAFGNDVSRIYADEMNLKQISRLTTFSISYKMIINTYICFVLTWKTELDSKVKVPTLTLAHHKINGEEAKGILNSLN